MMLHLKCSNSEEYLNEHELYEVMKSRNLYQSQFGVRMNFKKTIRNIAIAEKAQRYGFENSRKLFVQKMRERREQADKLRQITSSFKPKTGGDKNGKRKIERRYVPIPQSTTIYSEFPAIAPVKRANSPAPSMLSGHDRPTSKMTFPVPPTSSLMAATLYTEELERREEDFSPLKGVADDKGAFTLPAKIVVAGRETPITITRSPLSRRATEELHLTKPIPDMHQRYSVDIAHIDLFRDKTNTMMMNEEVLKQQEEFVKKTKKGCGKLIESTVQMADEPSAICTVDTINLPEEVPAKQTTKTYYETTAEKCESWREKHGLVSADNVEKESILSRLMVDRPSKFTLSHVQDDRFMDAVDVRYRMIQKIAREMDDSFQRRNKKVDPVLENNAQPKKNSYVSLPEIDRKPKPMVTLDPGGTTPDGRLILTQADYEDYLSGFKKARTIRLEKAKKHEQHVAKKVKDFQITQTLRLRVPTRLENPVPLLRA